MLNDDEVAGRDTAEARRAFGVTKAFVEPTTARAEANAVFMVELEFVLVAKGELVFCGEGQERCDTARKIDKARWVRQDLISTSFNAA